MTMEIAQIRFAVIYNMFLSFQNKRQMENKTQKYRKSKKQINRRTMNTNNQKTPHLPLWLRSLTQRNGHK